MIIKLLIIGIVLVLVVLIYPEEIIQFSKGFTLQEKTEQNFIDLKDNTIDEVGDTIDEAGDIIGETFHKAGNKIEDTVNNLFSKT